MKWYSYSYSKPHADRVRVPPWAEYEYETQGFQSTATLQVVAFAEESQKMRQFLGCTQVYRLVKWSARKSQLQSGKCRPFGRRRKSSLQICKANRTEISHWKKVCVSAIRVHGKFQSPQESALNASFVCIDSWEDE